MTTPNIVVLTGAGISAESGLGTFRDPAGIWAKFNPMELATPEGFARDPAKVQEFYNLRRRNLIASAPNPAHFALAELGPALAAAGGSLTLVTQNIDDLHERAGSTDVIHMHGELLKARCGACGDVFETRQDLSPDDTCIQCSETGAVRPHVVWFNEMPMHMEEIFEKLGRASLFVSIGTSGTVWPAAGFVLEAREHGARTLELNLEPSDGGRVFDEGRYGPASALVPSWTREVLESLG